MKRIIVLFLGLLAATTAFAQDPVIEAVSINPDSASVPIGGLYQFAATVTDTADAVVNTTVVWTVTGDVGTISASGLFTSSAAGMGMVIAAVGDIADTSSIEVYDPTPVPVPDTVEITPESHTVTVGDSAQFHAVVKDSADTTLDVEVTWTSGDTLIGTVDDTGKFTSLTVGETWVIASVDDIADTATVIVEEIPPELPPDTNLISVHRVKADGKITKFCSYIPEGDTLTIGGIPSPLNFMNGTKIFFPEGSLEEDILLTFKLPEFGKVHGNEVDFGDSIVTAVTFEVSVDGEPIHPYEFGVPLEVSIPFKRGLLNKRGIDPADLGMFYVTDDGELVEEGITDIAIDYENNIITGIVEHFSDIVLAPKQEPGEGGGESGSDDDTEVTVYPNKQKVAVGDTIQFQAQVKDSTGVVEDPAITWYVGDTEVGTIDETGMFVAIAIGETEVFAVAEADTGFAEVEVVEEVILEPGINTVNLQRIHPDEKITQFGATFAEGDTITIAGIPHPLNFMNGTKLIFAEGTLDEDILLSFRIPEFGHFLDEQVTFGDTIITAVTFEVTVGEELVHPYYFAEPIQVSLPYKRGLLDNLGITPYDLGMYFVSGEGDLVEAGITNIEVDEENNLITGWVEHFSDIALAPIDMIPTAVESNEAPAAYVLEANYPNPFNPTTSIGYTIPEAGLVRITIHNALGQQVRTLVNGFLPAGRHQVIWDGRADSGKAVADGLYLYRITAGSFTDARKMLLMK